MENPQIYVTCLAAYNDGQLHGTWIDANKDVDDIYDDIQIMLSMSPAESAGDWAIHAYEGFGQINIHEFESIENVVKLATFIVNQGELGATLLQNYSMEEAELLLCEHYQGSYDSEIGFAYALFNECYAQAMPEHLMSYIDYSAFARDLFSSDYFSVETNGYAHVFSSY